MTRAALILLAAILVPVFGSGCSLLWLDMPAPPSELPPAVMPKDCVTLEIMMLRVPDGESNELAPLWQELDEQHIPLDLRRRLDENGFRSGLTGTQLPGSIRQLLAAEENQLQGNNEQGIVVDNKITATRRLLQSRTGQRNEIIAGEEQPETVILEKRDGAIHGQTYSQSQCIFAVKTNPLGDGRVELDLTPELKYGQRQGQWVGQKNTGIQWLHAGKESKVFGRLHGVLRIAPGQTLVVAGTPEARGLGQSFFNEIDLDGKPVRKLLLIRLAQTQYDNLFEEQQHAAPIVNLQ